MRPARLFMLLSCSAVLLALSVARSYAQSTGTVISPNASTGAAASPIVSTGAAPSASSGPAAGATTALPALPPILSTGPSYGALLDLNKGPWVLGDVRFTGLQTISDYALQSKVRARRGTLYMPEDVASDVKSLQETSAFSNVKAAVYAMPEESVPAGYTTIAVSSSMVRLVFWLTEKQSAGTVGQTVSTTTAKKPLAMPPSPISGVVMTPTAYRGLGKYNEPGLGLDVNAMYYIGRLYGKNSLSYTNQKTNYLDRVGQWFLGVDSKMQLQSEGSVRPAAAVGGQGYLTFRDGPKPGVNSLPGVTLDLSQSGTQKTNKLVADAYFVMSKKFGPVRTSIGYMGGNFGDTIASLSEFLSPDNLLFNGHKAQVAMSRSVFFLSAFGVPKPSYPLGIEFLKPNGMALAPWLLNFKIGYFLHLNFDVSYLHFNGGWDLLGNFSFRTNYFPRR